MASEATQWAQCKPKFLIGTSWLSLARPQKCVGELSWPQGTFYHHRGVWYSYRPRLPKGDKPDIITINTAPRPHKRAFDNTTDYISYIPQVVYNHLRSVESKYLRFKFNCGCGHDSQAAVFMRGFTNSTPGCSFGAPFPCATNEYLKDIERTARTLVEYMKPHHVKPWGLLECAQRSDKIAIIEQEILDLGLDGFVRNPKRYMQVYEYYINKYNDGNPIEHTYLPPWHYLRSRSKIRPWAKREMLDSDKYPRAISPRAPEFNLIWAQFVGPLEEEMFKHLGPHGIFKKWCKVGSGKHKNRWIAKGMNKHQRGILTHDKWDNLAHKSGDEVVVLMLDCRGFDAHVENPYMKVALDVIKYTYSKDYHAYLTRIISKILENDIVGEGFLAKWLRGLMSGDRQTSFVACVDMILLIVTFMRKNGILYYDIFDDGDDCLLFIKKSDLERVQRMLPAFFITCGFELKVDGVARQITDIRWCQTAPISVDIEGVGTTYTYVQDPNRIFGTMGTHIHARNELDARAYFEMQYKAYSIIYGDYIPMFRNLDPRVVGKVVKALGPNQMYDILAARRYKISANANTMRDYCAAFAWPTSMYEYIGTLWEEPYPSTPTRLPVYQGDTGWRHGFQPM